MLIPAAPAFVGTFHLAAAATLAFMGANPGVAGSYAMVLWLNHFVSTTLLGLYYLWRLGLGWGSAYRQGPPGQGGLTRAIMPVNRPVATLTKGLGYP